MPTTPPPAPARSPHLDALREVFRRLAAAARQFLQAAAQAVRDLAARWAAIRAQQYPQRPPRITTAHLGAVSVWWAETRAAYGNLAIDTAGPLAQARRIRMTEQRWV